MKKYFLLIILIFGFTFPLAYSYAATGFVPGQIWYSPEKLSEGETVKIHTVVWNGGDASLQTKVEFYDKNVILGTRDVTVLAGQLKEVSISWKITSGDHTISAKLISSSVTSNGKKEIITLDNTKTEESKIFIPVTISKINGEPATSSDIIKNEINKAESKIGDVIPASISTPVSDTFSKLDFIRDDTFLKIDEAKKETKTRLDLMNTQSSSGKVLDTKNKDSKINTTNTETEVVSSPTDKPIAYIKLFFLSILAFIFGNKIVFYGLIVIVTFLILRAIYRKIKR